MQVQLFSRTSDGYFLTLEGDAVYRYIPQIQNIFGKINESIGSSEGLDRSVSISTVESLAHSVIAPNLVELQTRYPDLTIEIDVSTRNVNIAKRESDIAIRLRLPDTGEYISRKLSNVDYILCATEELASKVKKGMSLPTISFANDFSSLPEAEHIYNTYGIDSVVFRSNSATVQCRAAQSGIGIALLPKYLFEKSNLVRIEEKPVLHREVWLLTRQSSSQLAGIRLVIDYIVKIFEHSQHLMTDD